MTLDKFIQMLGEHDWYYMYADDSRYYNKGREQSGAIDFALKHNPEWMPMYMHYLDFCTGKVSMSREAFVERRDQIKQELESKEKA